jgi:hypothetical protein
MHIADENVLKVFSVYNQFSSSQWKRIRATENITPTFLTSLQHGGRFEVLTALSMKGVTCGMWRHVINLKTNRLILDTRDLHLQVRWIG